MHDTVGYTRLSYSDWEAIRELMCKSECRLRCNNTSIMVCSFFGITHFWLNYRGIVNKQIDGLVQDCSNSNALAMELLQSCTKPSKCAVIVLCIHSTNNPRRGIPWFIFKFRFRLNFRITHQSSGNPKSIKSLIHYILVKIIVKSCVNC